MSKKILKGTVVSNKMQNTVIVDVIQRKKHPKYGKYFRVSKRYKAHVEDSGAYELGDEVTIQESKPISKEKRWRVVGGV